MKKVLKNIVVVAILFAMLLALTGCGNKVIATKKDAEMNGMKCDQRIEFKFKKDKIESIEWTMKFDDEDSAKEMNKNFETMASFVSAFGSDLGLETELKDKKLIINLDPETFASVYGAEEEIEEITKKELKENLKENGYKVK